MSSWLIPDMVCRHFSEVTPELLKKRNITVLLSDLDNTLATKNVSEPTEEVKRWAESLREAGIFLFIVSNNRSEERVRHYAGMLGVDYMSRAKKPRRTGLMQAMKTAGGIAGGTAILGDLLVTDIIGARRCGFAAIMVKPMDVLKHPGRALVFLLEQPAWQLGKRRGAWG